MKYIQIIVWVISLIVISIGGVLYLEHRHQDVMESLTAAKRDLEHLDEKVDENSETRKTSNERIYRALEALQKNDKELAVQVVEANYCCEVFGKKGAAKKKVKKKSASDVLPYALSFKTNPGVIVVERKEK
jgi:hypothetical protein